MLVDDFRKVVPESDQPDDDQPSEDMQGKKHKKIEDVLNMVTQKFTVENENKTWNMPIDEITSSRIYLKIEEYLKAPNKTKVNMIIFCGL